MPRPKKHPDHKDRAEQLMKELLDGLVSLWTSEKDPQLQSVAGELEMSAAKVRKLLITAGERDGERYFRNAVADHVLRLYREGKNVNEISGITGLSKSSVTGYTPHSKIIYSLETMSAEAERIKLYRKRCASIEEFHQHLDLPDEADYLWRTLIVFENYPFKTAGRGKDHTGATKFRYTVSRSTGSGGRHYAGTSIAGYGNELWITTADVVKEKSISRSTVNLAYRNGRDEQERWGFVSGPSKLGVPGSRSYLYAMFLRFGVITAAKV